MGLVAVALTDSPSFPTYPHSMSSVQVTSGLSAPFAATALMGKSGAVALLIVLFMAVTSCASAELIAVSSILTFDIYKAYVKPAASPSQLIIVSHAMICVFGLVMAIFATIWNVIGINLGWLFLTMGLLIGGAVFPIAFAITWRGQTKAGAISGALGGLAAGIIAWLTTAHQYYGAITVATTGTEYATLAGNLAAILTGLILTVSVSLIKPADFDWDITRSINAPSDVSTTTSESIDDDANMNRDLPTVQEEEKKMREDVMATEEPAKLRSTFKLACIAAFLLTFIMDFLIPIPMFLSHYVFSKGFFTAWVIITFVWVFCSAGISVVLPIVETLGFFKDLVKDVLLDFGGKRRKVTR